MSLILIRKQCPFCKRTYQRAFPSNGYIEYANGALVQDAFPNETAEAREFLITGICPECFDSMEVEDDQT